MQSRTMSLVEVITNVVVGYAVAVLTQLTVFPLFGLEAAFDEHLAIGLVFVGISLVRSYLLRRLFEAVNPSKKFTDSQDLAGASEQSRVPLQ